MRREEIRSSRVSARARPILARIGQYAHIYHSKGKASVRRATVEFIERGVGSRGHVEFGLAEM
jgi:hypothetical protein